MLDINCLFMLEPYSPFVCVCISKKKKSNWYIPFKNLYIRFKSNCYIPFKKNKKKSHTHTYIYI